MAEVKEENIPPPIVDRPEEFQDFICTLCQEIPYLGIPVITPCEHIFCKECIETHLTTHNATYCPNDRKPLSLYQDELEPIGGILKRVWERVHVKCGVKNERGTFLSCSWEGVLETYKSHVQECSLRIHNNNKKESTNQELKEMIESLRNELLEIKIQLEETKRELSVTNGDNNDLKQTLQQEKRKSDTWKKERNNIEKKLRQTEEKLKKKLVKEEKEVSSSFEFDESYTYDRFRVIELTKIICQHLECKPKDVNSSKIWINVKEMYADFRKDYINKPRNYVNNMKMLLATCYASTSWFTAKQKNQIKFWLNEMNK